MKTLELNPNSVCFTTGAFIKWDGEKWILNSLEDDTYYDGSIVEYKENSLTEDSNGCLHKLPFIETD